MQTNALSRRRGTKFNGTSAQSISVYYPGDASSRFQNVEFANGSGAGVTLASNVFVAGNAAQNRRLGIPTALTITGALSLGSTSITSATGSVSYDSCTAAVGAVFTGFTCDGPPPPVLNAPVRSPEQ